MSGRNTRRATAAQAAEADPEATEEENEPEVAAAVDQPAAAPAIPANITADQIVAAFLQQLQNPGQVNQNQVQVDPVESIEPLNRNSRLGSSIYSQSILAVTPTWNGDHQSLAAFANALLLRARTFRWSTNGPTDIVTIRQNANPADPGFNLFIDYRSVTLAMVEQARANRTNPRAIQNAKAMFECIATSLTGRIRSLLFEQAGNLPREDGPILFIKAITCSQAIGTAATIDSMRRLDNFDPATVKFDIIEVNTTMFNLLNQAAAISGRAFSNDVQVAYLIKTYERIKQPDAWVRWVETQRAKNPPPVVQELANDAVSHSSALANQDSWNPSKLSPMETVQAMIAKFKDEKKSNHKSGTKTPNDNPKKRKDSKKQDPAKKSKKSAKPTFLTFTTRGKNGPPHQIGDTKKWEDITYFYCDCPNHKDKIHWHVHEAKDCRTRQKWLKSKENGGNPATPENPTTDTQANTASASEDTSARAYLGEMYRQATSDAQRTQIADLLESLEE